MSLSMKRGTTKTLELSLEDQNGQERLLVDGEHLRWGLKASAQQKNYTVVRDMTAKDYDADQHCFYVTINPSETESLAFGRYWFDAGIQLGDDSYISVMPLTPLDIVENITARSVET